MASAIAYDLSRNLTDRTEKNILRCNVVNYFSLAQLLWPDAIAPSER